MGFEILVHPAAPWCKVDPLAAPSPSPLDDMAEGESGMDRRMFLGTLAGGLLTAPFAAEAQQNARASRIGYLGIARGPLYDAFLRGMGELGYVAGENITVERRQYEGNIARLPAFAAELVRLKVEVIFATGPAAVRAVANATHEIPLVAIDLESDPIDAGFAASISRPGGNITGVFLDLPDLIGKWFEFLKATLPRLSHVAIFWDPATGRAQLTTASATAPLFAAQVQVLEVRGPEDFDRQFALAGRAHPDALIQLSSPLIFLAAKRIAEFAVKKRLPAISLFAAFPESGGLMSYGPDIPDLYRRSGVYVARILKGATVGELPIERPAHFLLVINLKTAKSLGLTIPQSLLLRADEVIQ
jgi:putative ABC transport system substrate-binding protein